MNPITRTLAMPLLAIALQPAFAAQLEQPTQPTSSIASARTASLPTAFLCASAPSASQGRCRLRRLHRLRHPRWIVRRHRGLCGRHRCAKCQGNTLPSGRSSGDAVRSVHKSAADSNISIRI